MSSLLELTTFFEFLILILIFIVFNNFKKIFRFNKGEKISSYWRNLKGIIFNMDTPGGKKKSNLATPPTASSSSSSGSTLENLPSGGSGASGSGDSDSGRKRKDEKKSERKVEVFDDPAEGAIRESASRESGPRVESIIEQDKYSISFPTEKGIQDLEYEDWSIIMNTTSLLCDWPGLSKEQKLDILRQDLLNFFSKKPPYFKNQKLALFRSILCSHKLRYFTGDDFVRDTFKKGELEPLDDDKIIAFFRYTKNLKREHVESLVKLFNDSIEIEKQKSIAPIEEFNIEHEKLIKKRDITMSYIENVFIPQMLREKSFDGNSLRPPHELVKIYQEFYEEAEGIKATAWERISGDYNTALAKITEERDRQLANGISTRRFNIMRLFGKRTIEEEVSKNVPADYFSINADNIFSRNWPTIRLPMYGLNHKYGPIYKEHSEKYWLSLSDILFSPRVLIHRIKNILFFENMGSFSKRLYNRSNDFSKLGSFFDVEVFLQPYMFRDRNMSRFNLYDILEIPEFSIELLKLGSIKYLKAMDPHMCLQFIEEEERLKSYILKSLDVSSGINYEVYRFLTKKPTKARGFTYFMKASARNDFLNFESLLPTIEDLYRSKFLNSKPIIRPFILSQKKYGLSYNRSILGDFKSTLPTFDKFLSLKKYNKYKGLDSIKKKKK